MINLRIAAGALGAVAVGFGIPLIVGSGAAQASPASAHAPASAAVRAVSVPVAPPVNPKAPRPTRLKILSITPGEGRYGTGIVVNLTFNREIPEKYRDEVIARLQVETSKPIGASGWAWDSASSVKFRPKEFWPANTKVKLSGNFAGLKLGRVTIDGEKRALVGGKAFKRDFTIGRSQIIKINGQSHWAKVVRNGNVIKEMPVSLGKPGWVTRSGVKVLEDGHYKVRMTSAAIGAEHYYDMDVFYAVRITSTGEFIHAAPWNGQIGWANASHGCTNMHTGDAQWVYNNYLVGDPVVTTGTGRPMSSWNGMGGAWNVPWNTWTQGKAWF